MIAGEIKQEWYTMGDLAREYGCDKRTLEKVLRKLREAYDIPECCWNGIRRVHQPSFFRASVEYNDISF